MKTNMSKPFALRKRQFAGYKTVCQVCGLCVNVRHKLMTHEPVWITKTTYKILSFKEETLEKTNERVKTYYKFVAKELETGLL